MLTSTQTLWRRGNLVAGLPFFRAKGMQGQRMNPGVKFISQAGIDRLVPLYLALALEQGRHQGHFEMGFRTRRNRMHIAFIHHLQMSWLEILVEFGMYLIFNRVHSNNLGCGNAQG